MRVGCSVRLPTGVVESAPSQLESIGVVVFLDLVPLVLVDFFVFSFLQVLTLENRETLTNFHKSESHLQNSTFTNFITNCTRLRHHAQLLCF